jgi:hypothetical protein
MPSIEPSEPSNDPPRPVSDGDPGRRPRDRLRKHDYRPITWASPEIVEASSYSPATQPAGPIACNTIITA